MMLTAIKKKTEVFLYYTIFSTPIIPGTSSNKIASIPSFNVESKALHPTQAPNKLTELPHPPAPTLPHLMATTTRATHCGRRPPFNACCPSPNATTL